MDLHTCLLFAGASVVLFLVPGPDMLFLFGRTIAYGRRAGIWAAVGINLGSYVHLCTAITGLSALIVTSATAFAAVKYAGATYLLYLGWQAWRSKSGLAISTGRPAASAAQHVWQGFLNDVLNPKVALFYLALLPQFISTTDPQSVRHLFLLGMIASGIGLAMSLSYVFLAACLIRALQHRPALGRWINRAVGTLFIGLGIRLASARL
ncbi:LysE family translocator [Luteibacter aegosomatissinici]|uniref:LysE family translocator n=1 Tax=Luteibacter aegosomatissinici TaxID=2911539 RepID=UPI001FF85E74|nr:LysE family translocator [Luteibacter aegosomatissinici]UPG96072.1 LysE family translocator [Luteibacter aegosomatissinici]